MSTEWIECGLPWNYYGYWEDDPTPPDLTKEEKKKFGQTVAQSYKELENMYKGCIKPDDFDKVTKSKEFKAVQRKHRKFVDKVAEWKEEHPLWLAYQEDMVTWDYEYKQKSFCGKGLNKPGTLVEIKEGRELHQLLIGDINVLGGACDDCMAFDRSTIVVRYKVLDAIFGDENV